MTFKDFVRNRILREIFKDSHGWKVLILDKHTLALTNSLFSMSEVLDQNITLIEDISRKRAPFNQDVIYFLSPTAESVNLMINDYSGKQMYQKAYLYFSSTIDDRLFNRLKSSPIAKFIGSIKELSYDYAFVNDFCFTLNTPCPDPVPVAKRLSSVVSTLGEYPFIRYVKQTHSLARVLQSDIDDLIRRNEELSIDSNCVMILLHRGITIQLTLGMDCVTPLIHDFGYQALVRDLLPFSANKHTYIEHGKETQVYITDDPVFTQIQHEHVADAMNILSEGVAELQKQSEGFGDSSVDGLKDAVANLPQYTLMKEKYTIHTKLCQECMSIYKETNLEAVSEYEQDLCTGHTSAGKESRNLYTTLLTLCQDTSVDQDTKLRLIMLFVIVNNGISETQRSELIDAAHLNLMDIQALTNLSLLGVRLSSSYKEEEKNTYVQWNRKFEKGFKFENWRYIPMLKYIMEDLFKNKLDDNMFSWIKPPPGTTYHSIIDTNFLF
jgi:syntaxin-binding protein 1